jgi:class 3 adenylate cyclase
MAGMIDRGSLHSVTLRFLDAELEDTYQREEGEAGSSGFRLIAGATVLLWSVAAVLIPMGTNLPASVTVPVGGSMALAGLACYSLSRWATTLNRQHVLASGLTAANGLVILILASVGDVVKGYAVGGIMLLFAYGFLSRTRFVHATARTVVISIGLAVTIAIYDGPGSLLIDIFLFVTAALGTLLALRFLERDRRRVWHQRLVIAEQTEAIEKEKAESERLLLNILPASVSFRLKGGEFPIADDFPSVSVVFADIVGFTSLAATLSAGEVISMLTSLYTCFDDLVTSRGLEKIKTIGDAYMAVGGLPEPLDGHAERIIDLAAAMIATTGPGGLLPGLAIRIGVHSGPAAGGVIGSRKFAYDVWGDTVNIASRLEQAGVPGRIHVSQETRAMAANSYEFEPRGPIELRGLGAMPTYLVLTPEPASELTR